MKLIINGESEELPEDIQIAGILESLGISADHHGIAVAVNEQIVPRSEWTTRQLAEQDRIEIVQAVQGG